MGLIKALKVSMKPEVHGHNKNRVDLCVLSVLAILIGRNGNFAKVNGFLSKRLK